MLARAEEELLTCLIDYAGLFPPAYRGSVFVCDPANNLVHRDVLVPQGPTFVARRGEAGHEFLAFVAHYGLPVPQINVKLNGREVDVLFPDHKLIVELDGWGFHNDRHAFETDRERDAENLRLGYRTVRITRERFTQAPDREAARLHEILRARG